MRAYCLSLRTRTPFVAINVPEVALRIMFDAK